jgi:hypothetical protein
MVTASQLPFDAYRVNGCAALQMMTQGQQWREQLLKLEERRLERDRAALEGALQTLREAKDWTDFVTASQTVLRDYLSATAAMWQESVGASMQSAGAWSDSARDFVQNCQDSLSGLQAGWQASFQPGAATASALPMRDWMVAFERAVSGAVLNGAHAAPGTANGTGKAAAHAQGDHHGR